MKKTYSKTKTTCRVTFELPAEVEATSVALVGEFNDWDATRNPMKQRKGGRFSTTISLQAGREYRFRYFLDGERWENDWNADKYLTNDQGSEDSVIVL